MIVDLRKTGFYLDGEKITFISPYLQYNLNIEENVTLEDIFDALYNLEDIEISFNPWTRGHEFEPFYNELKSVPKKENDIISLHFGWVAEVTEWENDDCEMENEMYEYVNMSGISDDGNFYGLDFTPLSELKDCTISLDSKWKLVKNYTETIFETKKEFNLGDIIGTLLYEISFHGYPENREETSESLKETMDRIENGEEETISWENVQVDFLEKQLERLVEEEKYEKAEKIRKRIEELKNSENYEK
jgi:hypothetical protein